MSVQEVGVQSSNSAQKTRRFGSPGDSLGTRRLTSGGSRSGLTLAGKKWTELAPSGISRLNEVIPGKPCRGEMGMSPETCTEAAEQVSSLDAQHLHCLHLRVLWLLGRGVSHSDPPPGLALIYLGGRTLTSATRGLPSAAFKPLKAVGTVGTVRSPMMAVLLPFWALRCWRGPSSEGDSTRLLGSKCLHW